MTKKRFTEILEEYQYSERQIELLWNSRPSDDLSEERLRETAVAIKSEKDKLMQA